MIRYKHGFALLFALLFAVHIFSSALPALAAGEVPTSSVRSYLLADAASGDILIANKPNDKIYPASTTKIMTALLLIENAPDLSQTVTVGSEITTIASDSSVMGIKKGEVISLRDLLYGLMLPSGNDAATTVAVAVGGSISGFVQMMNDKAASLGLSNTRYANPHGLHDADHYTTAADMAKLTAVALKNEMFRTVVSSSSYKVEATNKHPDGFTIYNSNKLVSTRDVNKDYFYSYAIGVKTGYTDQALGCLVAAAQKDGQTFIAVMMGDDSAEGSQSMFKRFTDAKTFFEYGFSMRRLDLFSKIKSTALSAVLPGEKAQTQLSAIVRATSIIHWMDAVTAEQIVKSETKLDVSFDFAAAVASPKPTGTNAVVGTVAYSYQGVVLYTCEVIKTPVVKPGTSGSSAMIVLVSTILLSMAALLLILIILRRVTKTRSVHKSRYTTTKRGASKRSGSGKLRDPYDFRH